MVQYINQPTSKSSNKPKRIVDQVDFDESTMTAIKMTNRGYRVFPCKEDKKPYIKGWQHHKGFTVQEIQEWMKRNPRTLWAIHCNQGFYVIDLDTYNPRFGQPSQKLLAILKNLSKVRQRTLNNGLHFFVRGKKKSKNNFMPGIDLKGEGGYVILYHDPVDFGLMIPVRSKEDFENMLPTTDQIPIPKKAEIKRDVKQYLNGHLKSSSVDPEGERNDMLYQRLVDAVKNGDRRAWDEAIAIARRSGLSDDEIQGRINSVKKKVGNPPKPNTEPDKDIPVKKISQKISDTKKKEVKSKIKIDGGPFKVKYEIQPKIIYILDGCPEGEVVIDSGKAGSGKTRINIGTCCDEWNSLESRIPKDSTMLILTDENRVDIMLTPLIEHYQARDFVLPIPTKYIQPKEEKDQFEQYYQNLKRYAGDLNAKIVYIDQLPLFKNIDWNQEIGAKFVDWMQRLARELKILIIIGRNVGKNHKELDIDHAERGSVATFSDKPRIKNLTLRLEEGSPLQKELRREGTGTIQGVVKIQTKNSYGNLQGVLLQKHLKINSHENEVCWFQKVRKLKSKEMANIRHLCKESLAEKLESQIIDILNRDGHATKQDFYDEIDGKNDSISKALRRAIKKGKLIEAEGIYKKCIN